MDILTFVKLICEDLSIVPPIVKYDNKKFNSNTQLATLVVEKNGRKILYLRKKYNDVVTMMVCIAHELRHKYQIDNSLFDTSAYQTSTVLSNRDYNLQDVEIDANAYAYVIMYDNFGIDVKFNGLDRDIVQRIKKRAEKIRNEY